MPLIQVAGSIDAPETIREGLLCWLTIANPQTQLASDLVLGAIDTGASDSCVDVKLAEKLTLSVTGPGEHHVIGGGHIETALTHCLMRFDCGVTVELSGVAISDLGNTCAVLVGRDVLDKGVLQANFLTGIWTLHLDSDQPGVSIVHGS
jgi:hypothetical protein